jgi:hypothetical protein
MRVSWTGWTKHETSGCFPEESSHMNCGFHPKKKAVKQAKPVQLTYWTPICRGCDDELGASWGRKPLPKRKKRPTSNRG